MGDPESRRGGGSEDCPCFSTVRYPRQSSIYECALHTFFTPEAERAPSVTNLALSTLAQPIDVTKNSAHSPTTPNDRLLHQFTPFPRHVQKVGVDSTLAGRGGKPNRGGAGSEQFGSATRRGHFAVRHFLH